MVEQTKTEKTASDSKSIIVSRELHKRLMQLKLEMDLSSIPKVIESLMPNGK